MSDDLNYRAPHYYDFYKNDDQNVLGDEFFDLYREEEEDEGIEEEEGSFQTPRRSISLNEIFNISKDPVNILTEQLNGINLDISTPNTHFKRPISVENVTKYVSLAEQTRLFEMKTPERYKSKPPPQVVKFHQQQTTIAQSPQLTTKMRSRPVLALSAEQREMIELEEIKKHQFKAKEVNKDILSHFPRAHVEKKPNTQFEPFKLTEVKKKILPKFEAKTQFQANPVQKKIFQTVVGVPPKQTINATVTKTPSFMKESRLRGKQLTINANNGKLEYQLEAHHGIKLHRSPGVTKVNPFNVIKRSEESQRRKEERIKQILEEEKKMREFHAKPAPKFVRRKNDNCTVVSGSNSTCSNDENETIQVAFKARPAAVLHKKPFVPVKGQRPLTEIQEFQLSLDQRTKQREEFDRKIKENEVIMKTFKQKEEEAKRLHEEEALARLREQTIIKAQPIKKFKDFILKASDKDLTSPHTPKFCSRVKK